VTISSNRVEYHDEKVVFCEATDHKLRVCTCDLSILVRFPLLEGGSFRIRPVDLLVLINNLLSLDSWSRKEYFIFYDKNSRLASWNILCNIFSENPWQYFENDFWILLYRTILLLELGKLNLHATFSSRFWRGIWTGTCVKAVTIASPWLMKFSPKIVQLSFFQIFSAD
jgi:hypothetical protein